MPFPEPITAPAIAAPRRGLLASAPLAQAARWLVGGVTFVPEACTVSGPLPWVACAQGPDLDDTPYPRGEASEWRPVGLLGVDECSTMSGYDLTERERRARANLTATASWQAEREFSDAEASTAGGDANPHLTAATGWVTAESVTAQDEHPTLALALLEQGLAECLHGQRGMIHATPEVITLWSAAGLLAVEGQQLVTANDNIVVPGAGYSGDDPDGAPAAADSSWVYGTALVYQLRGEATAEGAGPERIDHERNTITTWVTQPLLLFTSPCCKIGAQVSITNP